jgi:hypothetical protein
MCWFLFQDVSAWQGGQSLSLQLWFFTVFCQARFPFLKINVPYQIIQLKTNKILFHLLSFSKILFRSFHIANISITKIISRPKLKAKHIFYNTFTSVMIYYDSLLPTSRNPFPTNFLPLSQVPFR